MPDCLFKRQNRKTEKYKKNTVFLLFLAGDLIYNTTIAEKIYTILIFVNNETGGLACYKINIILLMEVFT